MKVLLACSPAEDTVNYITTEKPFWKSSQRHRQVPTAGSSQQKPRAIMCSSQRVLLSCRRLEKELLSSGVALTSACVHCSWADSDPQLWAATQSAATDQPSILQLWTHLKLYWLDPLNSISLVRIQHFPNVIPLSCSSSYWGAHILSKYFPLSKRLSLVSLILPFPLFQEVP